MFVILIGLKYIKWYFYDIDVNVKYVIVWFGSFNKNKYCK